MKVRVRVISWDFRIKEGEGAGNGGKVNEKDKRRFYKNCKLNGTQVGGRLSIGVLRL